MSPQAVGERGDPASDGGSQALASGSAGDQPLAIEVRDLHKHFPIPGHRPETLKERSIHPFRRIESGLLKVLDGISFDVKQGEFFGVVGRNGSGKSTLLKLLASVYRADSGTIRVAGRLAPMIELGVGFRPELAARDNIVLNGMMMGLTEGEAKARCDAVIEFAELEKFVDLKLKNYSSGMRVRLAFATMIQADVDILVLDEVFAVGDAPFQEKCEEVFAGFRTDARKTVILVSNQMSKVERYCDRAMVIEEGKILRSGRPSAVAVEYTRLMRAHGSRRTITAEPDQAHVDDLTLQTTAGNGSTFEPGEEIRLRALAVAEKDIAPIGFRLQIRDESGVVVFKTSPRVIPGSDGLHANQTLPIEAVVENRLAPGRYLLSCGLSDHRNQKPAPASPWAQTEFRVRGGSGPPLGLVALDWELRSRKASPEHGGASQ